MTHLILGAGNLGLSLYHNLIACGQEVEILPRKHWDYPESGIHEILARRPDYIWCTIGAGSVEHAEKDFIPQINAHLRLPVELIQSTSPWTRLVFFSSDYAANPTSLYGLGKHWMEEAIEYLCPPDYQGFRKAVYIRVSSLYGMHRPQHTFPGRLLARYPSPCRVVISNNYVCPTPTDWIAQHLAIAIRRDASIFLSPDRAGFHMFPGGPIKATDWARMVLGDDYDIVEGESDIRRPSLWDLTRISSSFFPSTDCLRLWSVHGTQLMEALKHGDKTAG